MLSDIDRQSAVLRLKETPPAADKDSSYAVRVLGCPRCTATMERSVFARHSDIQVDTCKPHGIWFDLGELRRAIAFYADRQLDQTMGERRQASRLEPSREQPPNLWQFLRRLARDAILGPDTYDG